MDDENVEKVEKRGVMVDVDGIDEEDVQNMTLMTVFSFLGFYSEKRNFFFELYHR